MPKPILLEVMKARAGIPTNDLFAMLWAKKLRAGSSSVQTLTGIPPLTFKADGAPLISWSMKGNGSQQGTPTPDNPVIPEFVGVRTANLANLWSVDSTFLNLRYTTGTAMTISISGTKTNGNNVHSIATPNIILSAGKYTVKIKMIGGTITGSSDGVFFGINKDTYSRRTTPGVKSIGDVGTRTFTLSVDTLITSVDIAPGYGNSGSVFTDATFECGLYAGESAPADYEPFGYKIPITCGGETTPVYLGQTQTVRKIRKLVLTGDETSWVAGSASLFILDLPDVLNGSGITSCLCSHYNAVTNIEGGYSALSDGCCSVRYNQLKIWFRDIPVGVIDNFKSYLATQYAAGTPVTVWYVLAEPTTGIVNEPLAKIGDYADELHSTDSGVTIPTVKGQNVLTVDTPIQPSEMTITYKG